MYDIITFSSATIDIFMSSNNLAVVKNDKFYTKEGLCVPLGSKIHMDEVFFSVGGCGANAAVTFARQGLKTAYAGKIGKDFPGSEVKKELAEEGVDLEFLKESPEYNTALSVILSLPEVGRSILEKLGACHELEKKDIDFNKIKAKWFYVASLSGRSSQIFEPIIDFAEKNNIKVAANPGNTQLKEDLNILKSKLNKIDILLVNQEEAARLTDIDYQKEKEIFKKLDELVKGIVVMTKGPQGVTVSDGSYLYSAGIPKSELADRTGAGDAFGSGFVSGYIEKEDISYAIQLGTANATSCLQKMGATNGLLMKGEWGQWEKVEVEKVRI